MKQMSPRRQRRIEKILYRDRRGKAAIYNRIFLTGLAMLLQIAFAVGIIVLLFLENSSVATILLLVSNFIGFLILLHILNRNDNPSSKLNWVIVLLVLPIFGVLMFFLYGDGRPTKKMNKKIVEQQQINKAAYPPVPVLSQSFGKLNDFEEHPNESPSHYGITKYLSDYAGVPTSFDGDATYFASGKETFDAIMEAVNGAKKFILAEYFIIAPGKTWETFLKALLKKAEEGVIVRLIFDNAGCLRALPPKYDRYIESLHPNIKCLTFNPISPVFTVRINTRDHRKQIIVDGETAFTGGINLADEYVGEKVRFGHWKDSGLRVTGSAVNTFTMMFFNVWNAFRKDKDDISLFYTPEKADTATTLARGIAAKSYAVMQPFDDSPLDRESVSETVYLTVINRAKRYIWIYTPYMILNDELRTALQNAAKRGVDVRIVIPGIPDKKLTYRLTKANIPPLLKAGVKVYMYTPGFIHAKSILADDRIAVIGTVNLDYRSLYLNFENAVYFSDCKVADDLKRDCDATFPECHLVTKEDLHDNWFRRFGDSLLRIFETLF